MDQQAASETPLRVLIVDDNEILRDMITLMVKSLGYTASTAATGKEALARLADTPHDILLLDIMMPDMDGFEVCRRIRENPAQRDLYIIILSARVESEYKIKGLDLGAADYLTKPLIRSELQVKLRVGERLIRESHSRAEPPITLRAPPSPRSEDKPISRAIAFPPEHSQAAIRILSSFSQILHNKYSAMQVRVSIEQEGEKVRLIIETLEGERECIEETLTKEGIPARHESAKME
jgi:CheY-like chemotaxis protein